MKKINRKSILLVTACLINGISNIQAVMTDTEFSDSETQYPFVDERVVTPETTVEALGNEDAIAWENTHVLLRIMLENSYEGVDQIGFNAYGIPTDQGIIPLLWGVYRTSQIMHTPITEETSEWFDDVRSHLESQVVNKKITEKEETICKGLLPDANPEELHDAAEELSRLGLIDKITGAQFYSPLYG